MTRMTKILALMRCLMMVSMTRTSLFPAQGAIGDSISKSDPCIISGAESIREAVTPEPELILGKRRRAVVDYRKLNAELFGEGEAFEGEDEDEMTGDWGPASPSKDRKLTRLEANWQKRKRVGTTLSAGSLDTSRTSKRRFPTRPRLDSKVCCRYRLILRKNGRMSWLMTSC